MSSYNFNNKRRNRSTNPKPKYIIKEGEIFKTIDGYENYMISNYGTVINKYLGYKIKPKLNKNGYLSIGLYNEFNHKHFLIHRLVALHFILNPNIEKYNIVNHKDRNTLNNKVDNLEWCDQSYNVKYNNANKIASYNKSKKIACYTISNEFIGIFAGSNEAAKILGLDARRIRRCAECNGNPFNVNKKFKSSFTVKGYKFKPATDEQIKQLDHEFFESINK